MHPRTLPATATPRSGSAHSRTALPELVRRGTLRACRVLARGRALPGQDPSQPHEVHLIWFPDRGALNSYMEDPRRHALLAAIGDVFTSKQAVEVEMLGETSPT
jgi:hypothetical protein